MRDIKRTANGPVIIPADLIPQLEGLVVRMSVRLSATSVDEILTSGNTSSIAKIPTDDSGNLISRHIFAVLLDIKEIPSDNKVDQFIRGYPIAEMLPDDSTIVKVESRGLVARSNRSINRIIFYDSLDEMPPEIMLLVTSELTTSSRDTIIPALSSGYLNAPTPR